MKKKLSPSGRAVTAGRLRGFYESFDLSFRPRRRELPLYTTDFTVCVSDFDESAVTAPTRRRSWWS